MGVEYLLLPRSKALSPGTGVVFATGTAHWVPQRGEKPNAAVSELHLLVAMIMYICRISRPLNNSQQSKRPPFPLSRRYMYPTRPTLFFDEMLTWKAYVNWNSLGLTVAVAQARCISGRRMF